MRKTPGESGRDFEKFVDLLHDAVQNLTAFNEAVEKANKSTKAMGDAGPGGGAGGRASLGGKTAGGESGGGGLGGAAKATLEGIGGSLKTAIFKAGKDVAFGIASDAFMQGSKFDFGRSVESNALRAGAKLGIPGYAQAEEPLEAAGSRAAAVTTQIARAGGTVTDEMRRSLMSSFLPQEKRATQESIEMHRVQGDFVQQAMGGTAIGNAADKIGETAQRFIIALEEMIRSMSGHHTRR